MPVADLIIENQQSRNNVLNWLGYLAAILSTAVFTLALRSVDVYLPLGRFPIIYILLVMAIAYFFGLGPSLVTFFLTLFAFIYFFVPPNDAIWPLATTPLGWAGIVTLFLGAHIGGIAALALRRYQRHTAELARQLSQSEKKYRLLFENMREMVAVERLVYDAEGNPVSWVYEDANPAYLEVTELTHEQAEGRQVDELFPDNTVIDSLLLMYARVVSTGHAERTEIYFPPLKRHLLVSAFPLSGSRFATLITDITEVRQAEEALQRYRLLSENARDIILFVNTDGQIIEANSAAVEAYGYTYDELLTMSIHDLRASDTAHLTAEQMEAAADGGILFETRHLRKDGTTFPVEVSSQGAMMSGGKVLLSIVRDITERKKAQEQLDLERRRLQAVMDALPVGVFIADADGRIVLTNEIVDRIWGGKAPHVDGVDKYGVYKGWWADTGELLKSEDWALARALTRGETSTGEVINIQRFDGSRGTILNNAAPIYDHEGRVLGAVVAVDDITELNALRQELERLLEEEKKESHRVAALESIAEAGIATLDLQELLNILAIRISETLGAHSCSILILDENSDEFEVRAVCGEPFDTGQRFNATEGFIGKINGEKKTVYVEDAQTDALITSPLIRNTPARSLLGTPLIIRGKVVGVTYIDMTDIHYYSDEDIRLFEAMASRASSAIENSQLHEQLMQSREELQHHLAQLQQALVPATPFIEDHYDVAAVYVPSMAVGQEIGGDFYDVFRTREGKYGVFIGDVSGKGIPAASMAATTRSTIHAIAYESSCASDTLTRTNDVLCSQIGDFGPFVTVFLAVMDVESGEICYASAGHPPTVLCCRDGTVEFLKSGQPPMGLACHQEYTAYTYILQPGDKIVMYTDGITEAMHGNEMFELEGVLRTVEQNKRLAAKNLTQRLLKAASDWAEGNLNDDAAVVVVERLQDAS